MKRRTSVLLFVLCLPLLAGCQGPKGSPEASVKSYFASASSRSYGTMARILAKDSIAKLGSPERAEAYLSGVFSGWSEFEVEIEDWSISADHVTATVRFQCKAMVLNNKDLKLHPGKCSDTYSLVKEEDGKWHVILPETQPLRPM